jgi:hypothetical protein
MDGAKPRRHIPPDPAPDSAVLVVPKKRAMVAHFERQKYPQKYALTDIVGQQMSSKRADHR